MFLLSFNFVFASEMPEITDDVEIRYKWYKEIITGEYYLKKDIKENDLIDEYNIKYGNYSNSISPDNCKLSRDYYDIDATLINVYLKVKDTRYILFENFTYKDNISLETIFQRNPEIIEKGEPNA